MHLTIYEPNWKKTNENQRTLQTKYEIIATTVCMHMYVTCYNNFIVTMEINCFYTTHEIITAVDKTMQTFL